MKRIIAFLIVAVAGIANAATYNIDAVAAKNLVVPRSLVINMCDFTDRWVDRAVGLKLKTLSICEGDAAVDALLETCQNSAFRARVDRANARGLQIGYQYHVGSWLVPRSLFQEHPEYFRMDAAGKRTPRTNFCVSSEGALKVAAERARRLARGLYRNGDKFHFWLDDVGSIVNAHMSACHCPKCAPYSASDQQLMILNRLLAEIRKDIPQAKLSYLAYFGSIVPPAKVKPVPGIFLEYAPITRQWNVPIVRQQVVKGVDVDALLKLFGRADSEVLEYWVDNSLFCGWRRPPKKFVPNNEVMREDFRWYEQRGFSEISSFACFLGDDYEKLWGEPDLTGFARENAGKR